MNKIELRIKILEEIESKSEVDEKILGVSENDFDDAVNFLKREGYIGGVFYADNRPWITKGVNHLTEKGENY